MLASALCLAALAVGAWLAARALQLWRYYAVLARLPTPDGGAGHLRALANPRRHHTILRWANELGPIFVLRVLWMRIVVLTDPAAVSALFSRSVLSERPPAISQMDGMFSPKGHPGLFSATSTQSPHWRAVRKGTFQAFNPRNLRAGFPHIVAAAREGCAVLQAAGPATPVEVDSLLQREALDVIGRVGFAHDFRAIQGYGKADGDDAMGNVFHQATECLKEIHLRLGNPLRRHLRFLPGVRKGNAHFAAFQAHMHSLMKTIQARGPLAASDTSLAAHLLRVRDPLTGDPLSDDRLLPEISTFFIAGSDTTGHTMAFFLMHMAQYPETEARVCEELGGLGLLATPTNPDPRPVAFEDLNRMPYLSACIKESMRLLPVTADGSMRIFNQEVEACGYRIPARTTVWMYRFTMQNSPRYWEDPGSFLPERWLAPGAEYYTPEAASATAPETPTQHEGRAGPLGLAEPATEEERAWSKGAAAAMAPAAGNSSRDSGSIGKHAAVGPAEERRPLRFYPFGQGARDCIGQALAKTNYSATLATLLGRFHFRLAPQMEGPGGASECDVVHFTMAPAHGMWLLCEPRA